MFQLYFGFFGNASLNLLAGLEVCHEAPIN